MKTPHFMGSYVKKTASLRELHDEETAMSQAVGGEFNAIGALEFFLLKQEGLLPSHTVIDAGCGSGRLAVHLRDYLTGPYIGFDVVPDLLRHAEQLCERPDWRFYRAPGTNIPEPDASADFVAFFSVFTHLLHEETYRYLEDSVRVLKPGGKIVFSFLEFCLASHWNVFDASVKDASPDKVLNQFMDRDMIKGFAARLNLEVLNIYAGDTSYIQLERVVRWDDGREMAGFGSMGQSVCVLCKPS